MLEDFQLHINTKLSFLKEKALLVGVSGGVDSVVLAHLCVQSQLKVCLAHCNFKLRGEESNEDELFVKTMAKTLGVEVFTQHFDTTVYAETHKMSLQMAARKLRYEWFKDVSITLGVEYVLTAHHADDTLETFLINLSRGTGIVGLLGIPEVNETIVRPLLPFSRTELLNYAKKEELSWREDSSNASTKYLRNALRHDVIPQLKAITPQFLANFQKTLCHLKDSEAILTTHIKDILASSIIKTDGDTMFYSIAKLEQLIPLRTYIYYIFEPYGFLDWNAIVDLLSAQSGKQVVSKTHQLLKNRETLILSPIKKQEAFEELFVYNNTQTISTSSGIITVEKVGKIQDDDTNSVFIDADKIKYPLKIRKYRKGDYFCPFGMQGKKKLSKFFKDEKLSLIDKNKVLLLCSEDTIVWVINYRLDNRFKVSNTTNSILRISCNT